MSYTLIIPANVEKYIHSIPEKDKNLIFDKLRILENEPRCYGSLKLKGTDSQ